MGRYIGPSCRKCRQVGERLFLKATKCYGAKCILERRNSRPGQHGRIRKKVSEYAIQLSEKQKLRNMYGMNEKQFRIYFQKASRMKGITGHNLMILLERRLDNVLMRSGLASSRNQARQFIGHGHVMVNDKRVTITSYMLSQGDQISICEKEKSRKMVESASEISGGRPVPEWIKSDPKSLKAEVFTLPKVEDIDHSINVQLIVELYSK